MGCNRSAAQGIIIVWDDERLDPSPSPEMKTGIQAMVIASEEFPAMACCVRLSGSRNHATIAHNLLIKLQGILHA